ncbi:hypothetical protein ACWKSP_34915 [Micromonosporaceae bacterium Da 78-11]
MNRLFCQRAIAAVVAGLLGYVCPAMPADLDAFAALGQELLEGRFAAVYDNAWNQAGPVQLLVSRLLMIGGRDGTPAPLLMAAVNIGLVLAAMSACARLTDDRGAGLARRETVVGVLTLLWLAVPMPWNGHPVELAVPLCWAYAIVSQKQGRWWVAAVVLAAASAIAPWAVLGFPCLFAVPGLRRVGGTGLLATALGVGCYLPFVLTGHFAMFHYRWGVGDGTLLHFLAPGLPDVTWPVRILQGVVVAAGCGLVAWRCRDDRLVLAAAPLTAALLRVATDPKDYTYYWLPVAVTTILLPAVLPATQPRLRRLLAVALGYLVLPAEATRWAGPGAVVCLLVLLTLLSPAACRTAAPRFALD